MARHRWATGERTSTPDRLERVLQLSRAPDSDAEPDWGEDNNGEDRAYDGGSFDLFDPHAHGAGRPDPERRRSGRRWVATRRAALLAAGCALTVGGWQFVNADRGSTEVVPIGPPSSSAPGAPPSSHPSTEASPPAEGDQAVSQPGEGPGDADAGTVVVHVAGAVQAPGVVEAAAGSRVFEVLEKAGGALPDAELSAVNLAAVIQDGQQIIIPRVGEPVPPVNDAPAADSAAGSGLTNLNTADATELEELPRVGPVLAERIVEWRTQHGPFAQPEDLDAVPGIGPAMLESLLPLVTV